MAIKVKGLFEKMNVFKQTIDFQVKGVRPNIQESPRQFIVQFFELAPEYWAKYIRQGYITELVLKKFMEKASHVQVGYWTDQTDYMTAGDEAQAIVDGKHPNFKLEEGKVISK